MTRVVAVHAEDFDCIVEAGVTRTMLNQQLRATGLFFPVDPGAGRRRSAEWLQRGFRNERRPVRHHAAGGEMRNGRARVGRRSHHRKPGAEERGGPRSHEPIRRLRRDARHHYGIDPCAASDPRNRGFCRMSVRQCAGAAEATIAAMQAGLDVARIEFLDAKQIWAVNQYAKTHFPEQPTLFVEFHGSPLGVREHVERFEEIAKGCGAESFASAESEDNRRRLWQARHSAFWAVRAVWPQKTTFVSDVCVPISRLADCITETISDIEARGLTAPIVGHVGDGNFHAIFVADAGNEGEISAVRDCLDRMAERALSMAARAPASMELGKESESC